LREMALSAHLSAQTSSQGGHIGAVAVKMGKERGTKYLVCPSCHQSFPEERPVGKRKRSRFCHQCKIQTPQKPREQRSCRYMIRVNGIQRKENSCVTIASLELSIVGCEMSAQSFPVSDVRPLTEVPKSSRYYVDNVNWHVYLVNMEIYPVEVAIFPTLFSLIDSRTDVRVLMLDPKAKRIVLPSQPLTQEVSGLVQAGEFTVVPRGSFVRGPKEPIAKYWLNFGFLSLVGQPMVKGVVYNVICNQEVIYDPK